MEQSPNLLLPYILAAQAQKHVTHNEAVRSLDAVVQLSVLDRDLTAPPASPTDGDRYIVAIGPSGAWTGHALQIAAFQDGAWMFYVPREGWLAWVGDEDNVVAWDGSQWVVVGGGNVNPTALVGVNTTADAANRLSVASANTLFTHAGSDHRVKINKANAAATASVLYQDNFSGRAEIGLTGDDDLHLKVSADGSIWREAMIVNRNSGAVSFPNTSIGGGSGLLAHFNAVDFGILPNGSDMTAALNALLALVYAAGGGTIVFGAGTYRFDSAITLPNDGVSAFAPRNRPMRFIGAGCHWSGQGSGVVNGGTVFDLRSSDPAGRLRTLGLGFFEMTGITHTDGRGAAASATPFFLTTNTSCFIHGCAFFGNRQNLLCDQDAIICGGTSLTIDNTTNSPFQGYGTVIEKNFFEQIRRGVYGRTYANGINIRENWCERRSGSNLAGGAFIEFDAGPDVCAGNNIIGNTIEIANYPYAIKLTSKCVRFTIIGNVCADDTSTSLACVRIDDASCTDNIVMGSLGVPANYLSDAGARTQYIATEQGTYSKLGPTEFANDAGYPTRVWYQRFLGGNQAFVMKPAVDAVGGDLFQMRRSDLNAAGTSPNTNPNEIIYTIGYQGDIKWGGVSQGNITTTLGNATSWSNSGRKWACNGSGGAMEQNSGTGGSIFTMQNYGIDFKSHTGALQGQWGYGVNGIKYGSALDANWIRHASVAMMMSDVPIRGKSDTLANFPAAAANFRGSTGYCTNGRKSGEGAGAGTGIPIYCDGTNWRTYYDNSVAAA